MKKIIVIPDSFKGTMSSIEICTVMETSIHRIFPDAEVVTIPVADGGEGSTDCFLHALGGLRISVQVQGPFGEEVDGFYGLLPDGTAVVEMAAAAGLTLADEQKNPELTSTYGVGQLIGHALENGCRRIVLGLGGSATNDGGCGMAAALGARFLDGDNLAFVPVGGTLKDIARIELTDLMPALADAQITAMCDIDNPLFGENGAAYIFGPQKGADADAVVRLDEGLINLSDKILQCLGINVALLPGAGAAGGMGGGAVAFLGAQLVMGIETVLDVTHFDDVLKSADLVISGEGRIDTQSLRGKVIIGIARRTKAANVPLIAVVGDIGDDISEAYELGVSAVFSINNVAVPFSEAKLRSRDDLTATMDNLMRFAALFSN
jgi:glycerate kinase